MENLLETFNERRGDLWSELINHLGISVVSLLIAMLIAIPLAIWVVRHPKVAETGLQIAGILQTIPSLALLGLLIPIVGIGTTPAIIALVIYALLPIFQNTYLGISEIDPAIEEAADAFGMSKMRKLFKVELPMARPAIVSGIRTAMVLIIGTATLAALIGAGGLGTFILLGIDRNDMPLIIIGTISAALLSIILSSLIRWFERAKPWHSMVGLAILIILLGGGGVYSAYANRQQTVTIAGKLGSEPEILINMYKDLIEAEDADINVEIKPNFGKTTFLYNAVKNDQIDIYPEFTGTVLETLIDDESIDTQGLSEEETYNQAKEHLQKQDQLTLLEPMSYNNAYALAVSDEFKEEEHLGTISDLANIQSDIQAGMTLEFIDREDGLRGIEELYDLDFETSSMEPALRYQAIDDGRVNLIDAYSTDSELREYHLSILEDDKGLFPKYQGAPLMSTAFADDNPQVVEALDKLGGKITEEEMQEMNYEVNVEEETPADVAHSYLTENGLLEEDE